VKITIDTDVDSYQNAVQTLNAAYAVGDDEDDQEREPGAPKPAGSAKNGSTVIVGGWNAKKLRKWASYLKDDAAEVVRYVAAHAPEVSFDDVAEHLGTAKGLGGPVDGKVLGGAMSSGGHAANVISGVKGQPIDRDHARRMYVINEQVAQVLADELGAPTA